MHNIWRDIIIPGAVVHLLGQYGEAIQFVLDAPDHRWEVIRRLAASAPRESHPRVGLTRLPPLPVTDLRLPNAGSRRLWLDRSIIVPIAGHRRAGCRPALIVAVCRSLPVAGHGAAAKVAHAHHNSNGNVSDEWVCGFQRPDLFTARSGEQVEEKYPSTCFLTKRANLAPHSKNFFSFFSAASMERLIGIIVHPSISAICWYVLSSK